jgi:hypothetical protein
LKRYLLIILLAIFVIAYGGSVSADARASLQLRPRSTVATTTIATYAAISLPKGGMIHLNSQSNFFEINAVVTTAIKKTQQDLETFFGPLPAISIQVKLMTQEVFTLSTGVPSWTNALYYHDTIIIPINTARINEEELIRSVRHEFTHAVIHELSDGKCPGWLDEGLAQYMEGTPNPLIRLALAQWLSKNPPVPFHMLQKGFTKLEKKYVAPAYAQSLWAAHVMIQGQGFLKIRNYLDELRQGKRDPFFHSLGISEAGFESSFACALKNKSCLTNIESCTCETVQQSQLAMNF